MPEKIGIVRVLMVLMDFLRSIPAALITLAAGYLGATYGLRHLRVQQETSLIQRQLDEFYSPLLATRVHIRTKGEVRVKISKTARETWPKKAEHLRGRKEIWITSEEEEAFAPYQRSIEYNNRQLEQEIIPLYRQMVSIFRDKYWLAEPETRIWYPSLCTFVELWERWLSRSIPPEVLEQIDKTEEELYPFYSELEMRTEILRTRLRHSGLRGHIAIAWLRYRKRPENVEGSRKGTVMATGGGRGKTAPPAKS